MNTVEGFHARNYINVFQIKICFSRNKAQKKLPAEQEQTGSIRPNISGGFNA